MIFESNPMNSFFEEDYNFKVEECLNGVNNASFPELHSNALQLFQPANEEYERIFNETDSIVSDEPSSVFELDCNVSRRDTVLSDDTLLMRSPANMVKNIKPETTGVMFQQPQRPQQMWNENFSVPELFQTPAQQLPPLPDLVLKHEVVNPPVSSTENTSDDSDDALSTQVDSQKNGEVTKFCCHVCHKKFKRPSSLKTHMNIHTGDRPYPCPYNDCTKSFNAKSNMLRHYKLHFKLSKGVYMLPTGEISLEKPTARQLFQSSKDKSPKVQKKRKNSSQSHPSDDYLSEIEVSGSATPLNNNVFAKPYVEMPLQGDASTAFSQSGNFFEREM